MSHRAHPPVSDVVSADHPALENAEATQAYLDLLTATGPLPSPEELAYRRLLASPGTLTTPAPASTSAPTNKAPAASRRRPSARTAAPSRVTRAPRVQAQRSPDQHRPSPSADSRRFHSHRAPSAAAPFALLGERGRTAVLAAALVAGIGVVGASAAAASANTKSSETSSVRAAAQLPSRAAAHGPIDPATGYATDGDATTGDVVTGASVTGSGDEIGQTTGTAALHAAEAEQAAGRVGTGEGALAYAPVALKTRPVPKVTAQWVNPMPEGSVTSCFGPRWGRLHAGVDLATASGTPIRAAGAGVVVAAGPAGGYGNAVLIDHGNGYLTHYGHMSEIIVTVGQTLKTGEQIGMEGSTGHSTGPHLHFEVHEGHYKNPIEPTAWMRAHGVEIPGCSTTAPATDIPADDHSH